MNQASTNTPSLDTEKQVNKAIAYGCRVLGVREYSTKSMQLKMHNKGFEADVADKAIEFLIENNWLSDARYCESFVRSRISRGQGVNRIRYELTQKGLDNHLISEAIATNETDWQQLCFETAAKKIKDDNDLLDVKSRMKIQRFLNYRGFSSNEIKYALNKHLESVKATKGETKGEHVE